MIRRSRRWARRTILPRLSTSEAEKRAPGNAIVRQLDSPYTQFEGIRNQGKADQICIATNGKGPKDFAEIKATLATHKELMQMIEEGYVTVFYGVNRSQMEKGASNTILAHESYEDINGRRLVLMGDGSVREMTLRPSLPRHPRRSRLRLRAKPVRAA